MNNSIFLKPVDSVEIENLVIGKKKVVLFFVLGITNHILKKFSDFMVEPLSIIFNTFFEIGIFPTSLKKCLIAPIFKSGG